jgi:hypothetical protein
MGRELAFCFHGQKVGTLLSWAKSWHFVFMGRELAPCGLFVFAFQPRFFIGLLVWPLLPKIYDDMSLVKVRYVM